MNDQLLPVSVETSEMGGVLVIAVHGEIDLSNAARFREKLDAVPVRRRMAVDMRDVPFMDSTGLNGIAQYGRRVKAENGTLHLIIDRPVLRKIFDITGLSQHFPVVASVAGLPAE